MVEPGAGEVGAGEVGAGEVGAADERVVGGQERDQAEKVKITR